MLPVNKGDDLLSGILSFDAVLILTFTLCEAAILETAEAKELLGSF